MNLSSTAFTNGDEIPDKYGCRGADVNPPLEFGGQPSDSKTLALIVSDPDAPHGTFYHWIMWNLPSSQTSIPEGWAAPASVIVGVNGFGTRNWQGPCPPSGTHHYHFTIYALDEPLNLPSTASTTEILAAIGNHALAKGELVGTYSK